MTVRLNPDALFQQVADDMVILDRRSGQYYQLNRTGSEVIRVLQDDGDLGQAVERLVANHGAQPSVAQDDVNEFVEAMRRAGLIVP